MNFARTALILVFVVCLLVTSFPAALAAPDDQAAAQDKRIAEYTAIIDKNPHDAVAYYFRGLAYLAKRDYPNAQHDFTRALEINPRYAAAYYNRGWAYSMMQDDSKNVDKAIEDYTQAIGIDPAYGQVYSSRAYVYNKKEMYDQAIADCDKAFELGVKSIGTYFYKGLAQQRKGQYEEAIATYRQLMAATKDQTAIEQAKSLIRTLGGTP